MNFISYYSCTAEVFSTTNATLMASTGLNVNIPIASTLSMNMAADQTGTITGVITAAACLIIVIIVASTINLVIFLKRARRKEVGTAKINCKIATDPEDNKAEQDQCSGAAKETCLPSQKGMTLKLLNQSLPADHDIQSTVKIDKPKAIMNTYATSPRDLPPAVSFSLNSPEAMGETQRISLPNNDGEHAWLVVLTML